MGKEIRRKKPSTQRESNPRPPKFLLLRHLLNRCATTAATHHNFETFFQGSALLLRHRGELLRRWHRGAPVQPQHSGLELDRQRYLQRTAHPGSGKRLKHSRMLFNRLPLLASTAPLIHWLRIDPILSCGQVCLRQSAVKSN